jgi:hypothetical protein
MTHSLILKSKNFRLRFRITVMSRQTSSTIAALRQAFRFKRPICRR